MNHILHRVLYYPAEEEENHLHLVWIFRQFSALNEGLKVEIMRELLAHHPNTLERIQTYEHLDHVHIRHTFLDPNFQNTAASPTEDIISQIYSPSLTSEQRFCLIIRCISTIHHLMDSFSSHDRLHSYVALLRDKVLLKELQVIIPIISFYYEPDFPTEMVTKVLLFSRVHHSVIKAMIYNLPLLSVRKQIVDCLFTKVEEDFVVRILCDVSRRSADLREYINTQLFSRKEKLSDLFLTINTGRHHYFIHTILKNKNVDQLFWLTTFLESDSSHSFRKHLNELTVDFLHALFGAALHPPPTLSNEKENIDHLVLLGCPKDTAIELLPFLDELIPTMPTNDNSPPGACELFIPSCKKRFLFPFQLIQVPLPYFEKFFPILRVFLKLLIVYNWKLDQTEYIPLMNHFIAISSCSDNSHPRILLLGICFFCFQPLFFRNYFRQFIFNLEKHSHISHDLLILRVHNALGQYDVVKRILYHILVDAGIISPDYPEDSLPLHLLKERGDQVFQFGVDFLALKNSLLSRSFFFSQEYYVNCLMALLEKRYNHSTLNNFFNHDILKREITSHTLDTLEKGHDNSINLIPLFEKSIEYSLKQPPFLPLISFSALEKFIKKNNYSNKLSHLSLIYAITRYLFVKMESWDNGALEIPQPELRKIESRLEFLRTEPCYLKQTIVYAKTLDFHFIPQFLSTMLSLFPELFDPSQWLQLPLFQQPCLSYEPCCDLLKKTLREMQTPPANFCEWWTQYFLISPYTLLMKTLHIILPSPPQFFSLVINNPLLIFKAEKFIFSRAQLLKVFLRLLHFIMIGSRHIILKNVQKKPQNIQLLNAQESLIIQCLLEFLYNDNHIHVGEREECNIAICSFIHQLFVERQSLIKVVHFQTYNRAIIPLCVSGIPSMHMCFEFIQQLISQPSIDTKIFGIQLGMLLLEEFPIPKYFKVAESMVLLYASFLDNPSSCFEKNVSMPSFLRHTIPYLYHLCHAFPALIGRVTNFFYHPLLTQVVDLDNLSSPESSLKTLCDTTLQKILKIIC